VRARGERQPRSRVRKLLPRVHAVSDGPRAEKIASGASELTNTSPRAASCRSAVRPRPLSMCSRCSRPVVPILTALHVQSSVARLRTSATPDRTSLDVAPPVRRRGPRSRRRASRVFLECRRACSRRIPGSAPLPRDERAVQALQFRRARAGTACRRSRTVAPFWSSHRARVYLRLHLERDPPGKLP